MPTVDDVIDTLNEMSDKIKDLQPSIEAGFDGDIKSYMTGYTACLKDLANIFDDAIKNHLVVGDPS